MTDDKQICYRCRSEIYRHQGTAYYGYYIAHRSPDDCTSYLNRKIQELEKWRSVALRFGESLASNGPNGYYDMTPEQWLKWIDAVLEKREWDAL